MDFKPIIREEPDVMDVRIFRHEPMGLRDDLLSIPLDQRFTYDPQQNLFFVNFERFSLHNRAEIRAIVKTVEEKLAPLGHRVYAIVNYDNFSILPELLDEYSAAVRGPGGPVLFRGVAVHDQRFPAHKARRGAGKAGRCPAHLRERGGSAVGSPCLGEKRGKDLREFIELLDKLEALRGIEGADPRFEIGAISAARSALLRFLPRDS
jgi:hypothetical protein